MATEAQNQNAQALILRGIEAIERVHARVEALEKSADTLTKEVIAAREASAKTEAVLVRIALSEEKRAAVEERLETERQTWMQRLWESSTARVLMLGMTAGLLKFIGVLDVIPSMLTGWKQP